MISIALFGRLARMAPRALWRALAWFTALLIGSLAFFQPADAQDVPASLDAALLEQVRTLALGKTPALPAALGSPRVEVVVGTLDPRLHLAPCQRIEPYVPPNVRLWGKARIGLRCAQGVTAWNVYLPITVRVWGRALIAPAGGSAGAVLAAADVEEGDVDLAEEASPAIVDRQWLVGRVLAQSLKPGQAIRQAHVKARQWFAAGETVRVVAVGEGFSLESEAQAISNGIEGQPARVRTESGRVLTGIAGGERRLDVAL